MTTKQVQKKLNALCEGLGDAWIYNLNNNYNSIYREKTLFVNLSGSILFVFNWSKVVEHDVIWYELYCMLHEMEQAELI